MAWGKNLNVCSNVLCHVPLHKHTEFMIILELLKPVSWSNFSLEMIRNDKLELEFLHELRDYRISWTLRIWVDIWTELDIAKHWGLTTSDNQQLLTGLLNDCSMKRTNILKWLVLSGFLFLLECFLAYLRGNLNLEMSINLEMIEIKWENYKLQLVGGTVLQNTSIVFSFLNKYCC